jgi:F-type H+-transporting ATPase subunit epsilon
MKNIFKLKIITPDRRIYNGDAVELKTEGMEGKIEILYNHIPMIITLKPTITYFIDKDNKEQKLFTSYGTLKIKNNEVTLMCDAAEWPDEINTERAEAAKLRAEERLKTKDNIDTIRAETALYRALTRLRTKV